MLIICPHCQKDWTEYAKQTFPRQPQAGDWSICLGCLKVCRFDENCELVIANENELPEDILKSVEVFRYLKNNSKVLHHPSRTMH